MVPCPALRGFCVNLGWVILGVSRRTLSEDEINEYCISSNGCVASEVWNSRYQGGQRLGALAFLKSLTAEHSFHPSVLTGATWIDQHYPQIYAEKWKHSLRQVVMEALTKYKNQEINIFTQQLPFAMIASKVSMYSMWGSYTDANNPYVSMTKKACDLALKN